MSVVHIVKLRRSRVRGHCSHRFVSVSFLSSLCVVLMPRLKASLSNRKKNAASQALEAKRSEKNKQLYEGYSHYCYTTGCFKCKKKNNVKLQFSHFESVEGVEHFKPRTMVKFHATRGERDKKLVKLKIALAQGGILCHSCHTKFDAYLRGGPEVPWAENYRRDGAKIWTQYLKEYKAQHEVLELE